MIVQYLIDWHYIRQRINAECSDSFRLDILRKDLRRLRKNILVNGVVLRNENRLWTRELQNAIRELVQEGENDPIHEWALLANELKNYQKLYDTRRIMLPVDVNDIQSVLKVRRQRIDDANLFGFDLPCAVISDVAICAENGEEVIPIEKYEESRVERIRESWESASFSPSDKENRLDWRKYLAGMSFGAISYGEAVFYDPYCLCVLFRDGSQSGLLKNWDVSVLVFMSYFVRNRFVKHIKFVGQDAVVGKNAHLKELVERVRLLMDKRNCQRQEPIRISFAAKRDCEDWHNRYVVLGACVCSLPNGLDVFNETSTGCKINKHFVIKAERECNNEVDDNCGQLDYAHVRGLESIASYNDVVGLARKGIFSCDIDLQGCAPEAGCGDEFLSIEIFPKIRVVLG